MNKNYKLPFLKSSYEESRRLIRSAMQDGNLVIFVGAGTSIESGVPSWKSAIRRIADRLGIKASDADTLKISQYYFNARGKKDYTAFMREIFRYNIPLRTTDVHDALLRFNTGTIITTNYDHLLEDASENRGEFLYVVSRDQELPYKHGKELIKMHGDFESDNFVLKEDDYLQYDRNFKLMKNYIASLIGTKTVLFVGYSFNDPDVKQIFSWLKDALHGDFQRAYMISVEDYDEYVALYYKNFGINVLYGSVVHEFLDSKCEDVTDKSGLLLDTLNWILNDDTHTLLYKIYRSIGPYQYLYAGYTNEINNILKNNSFDIEKLVEKDAGKNESDTYHYYGLSISQSRIRYNDAKNVYVNSGYVLAKIKDADKAQEDVEADFNHRLSDTIILFLKICFVADYYSGKLPDGYPDMDVIRSQKWYQDIRQIHDFQHAVNTSTDSVYKITDEEWNKIRDILDVLYHSRYQSLVLSISVDDIPQEKGSDGAVEPTKNAFRNFYIPVPPKNTQYYSDSAQKSDALIDSIRNFDYKALQEMEIHNDSLIVGSDPDRMMEQAHIEYILGNYFKAYTLTKEAAGRFYHQVDYGKHFIAKYDQQKLGKAIVRSFYNYDANEEDVDHIRKDLKDLDMRSVLDSIPDLGGNATGNGIKNSFLEELSSFQLDYGMLQDVLRMSDKSQEEAESIYFIYGGNPAYEGIRDRVENFYEYQLKNHFFAVQDSSINDIYDMAVKAIFSSVTAIDRSIGHDAVDPNRFYSANVHAKELHKLDIELAVKYSKSKTLDSILSGCTNIRISERAKQYIMTLAVNLKNEPDNYLVFQDYMQKLVVICGYIRLDAEITEVLLESLLQKEYRTDRDSDWKQAATILMDNIYKQDIAKNSNTIQALLVRFVDAAFNEIGKDVSSARLGGTRTLGLQAARILDSCGHKYFNQTAYGILAAQTVLNQNGSERVADLSGVDHASDYIEEDQYPEFSEEVQDSLKSVHKEIEKDNKTRYGIKNYNEHEAAIFLADVYEYCTDDLKKTIRGWFANWTVDNNAGDYEVYSRCVQNDIMDQNPDIEGRTLDYLLKQATVLDEKHAKKSYSSSDNTYVNLAYSFVNLNIIKGVSDKGKLIRVCEALHMDAAAWILDPHDKNRFSNFESGWLRICGDDVLRDFSEDPELKKNIGERMKADYLRGELDDVLTEKYVRYFT